MTAASKDIFVTPAWLAEHLGASHVVVIDASFHLPDEGKDAEALFREAHIPGAVRFDVDAIADHTVDLPHMLPDAETFSRMVGALGVSERDTIVIYDTTDLLGGARAWWMFRHYGAQDVRLLEGGFRAWRESALPLEHGAATPRAKPFHAVINTRAVADVEAVLNASRSGSPQIVDARSATRFAGDVPEPRPGLRAGHIPNARNVPWRNLVDAGGRLRSPADVAEAFRNAGVDVGKPFITTCGSGVSAAILLLGLEYLGANAGTLYDGSWSEWGGRDDLPVETGPVRS